MSASLKELTSYEAELEQIQDVITDEDMKDLFSDQ